MTTRSGYILRCKHPGLPAWPLQHLGVMSTVLTDKLHDHYAGLTEVKYATYRNWPDIRNYLRHIKVRVVNPDIPRALTIDGRTVKIRLPGEYIRDTRCYRCGKAGHNRADCPDESHADSLAPTSNHTPTQLSQNSPHLSYADQLRSPPIDPPFPLAHPTTQSPVADHRLPPPKQQTAQQTPPQNQLTSPQTTPPLATS